MKAAREFDRKDGSQPTRLSELAAELGHDVARAVFSKKGAEISSLSSFLSSGQLATMTIEKTKPLTIDLVSCFDCDPAKVGTPLGGCYFKGKLLEAAVSSLLGLQVRGREVKCHKKGDSACEFRFQPSAASHSPLRVR